MPPFPWVPPKLLGPEIPPVARAICRAALEGADAFRATRRAVRLIDGTLRLGNRFVPVERYREIAFVALGNAAVSQALALSQTLGERLTQGFVAGPIPVPREIPFPGEVVSDMLPGSPEGIQAGAATMELAEGLREGDLLILLLSPGALGCLVAPWEGWDRYRFRQFLADLKGTGATSDEVARVLRVLGGGAVGGELLRRIRGAEVLPLVVDRGDGGELLGGGPMTPVSTAEKMDARQVLERTGLLRELPDPTRRRLAGESAMAAAGNLQRPVVIVSPAEALEAGGAAAADRKWVARLGTLSLRDPPAPAAARFLELVEKTLEQLGGVPASRGSFGVAVFAGLTLGTLEGGDDRNEVEAFLREAARGLKRRGESILLYRTVGPLGGAEASAGGLVGASGLEEGAGAGTADVVPSAAGITDVGSLAVAFVRPERDRVGVGPNALTRTVSPVSYENQTARH